MDGSRSIPFACIALLLIAGVPVQAQAVELPGLGMDQGSAARLRDADAAPDYGSFWIGEWTSRSGWGALDNTLRGNLASGTTPVVYWYYWGDSITPACVENGCADRTKEEWRSMTLTMADRIRSIMGGKEVLVVLENEFNKGGITDTWYAPTFDQYLADRAAELHAVPGVHVVLGYGSWGEDAWGRFPKAIAASDSIGFQIMRAQTRDSESTYRGADDKIASVLDKVKSLSGKRAFLYDLALSSYPDAYWERVQGETLKEILDRRAEYGADGLVGIVYRELRDNPNMGPENYFGYAEQHWGLQRTDGTPKLAWKAWLEAVGASPPPPPTVNVPGAFEGESMKATTGGRQADAAASAGAVWNLWTDGALSQALTASAGSYRVSIVARGTPAAGVDAQMAVRLDGATLATFPVPTGLRTYALDAALPEGVSTLTVSFTNDALVNGEDRNLLVDVVRIEGAKLNRAPVAAFAASAAGLAASFDASASTDADGDALAYAWSFGDGATATGRVATHAYAEPGSYVVTLEVSDGKAASAATQTVTVARPNRAPAAAIATSGADLAWRVDASGSTDPDGDALTYSWDMGDGTTAAGAAVSHAYAQPGSYVVRLTASDGTATSSATATIVAQQPNRAPVAAFAVSGAELTWSFDASASTDADGDSLRYLWDLGDGSTATGARVTHVYATSGDRVVRLQVLDGEGAAGETSAAVAARAPPPPAAGRVLEAEAFATREVGGSFADAKASGGSAWLLWSNGAIKQRFAPGAGTQRVEVVAKGDHGSGWPVMELRADGVAVARWTVASATWASYRADVSFGGGQARELSVHFLNDHYAAGADRNLRVDVVRVAPPGATVEAESFATKGPGMAYSDATASGGKAWLLWSNGALSTPVAQPAWTYEVQVVAKGDYARGWPTMELRADGVAVARWDVTSSTWATYKSTLTYAADGPKTLSVHFVNDFRDSTGDRNLRIDVLRIG